jgi:hypothetical protein
LAQSRGAQRKETVAAQVFLRSVSGRSFRGIAQGPLPDDLSPFRPTDAARTAVHRFLARAGFDVFSDESGLTLSIEGPPASFARVFGVEAAHLTEVRAQETVPLRPPPEIQELVDEIVVLPKPEFF